MSGRKRGFTLIELMIVIFVAALLLMIAIPTFSAQLRKSRRSEAVSILQQLALAQEQWRANHTTYGSAANLGSPTATHYDITVTNVASDTYTLTATAKSGDDQNNDRSGGTACIALALTKSSGTPTPAKSPAACW